MRVFKDECKLRKLDQGDCFWWDNDLFILTDRKTSEGNRQIVKLETGGMYQLEGDTLVRKERNAAVLCQPLS